MDEYEIVTFDPSDADTYPSVCADAGEVEARFGFVGGERLLFDATGSYVGQIVRQLGGDDHGQAVRAGAKNLAHAGESCDDPDCEIHHPEVIEDANERLTALAWLRAGMMRAGETE